MTICREIELSPHSATAFTVAPGQLVRIIDLAGGQPGDLVAFLQADTSIRLSQARSRVENGRVHVTAGCRLWSNRIPPEVMFELVADTGGPHDLLYPPCCRHALEKRFGVSRDGCLENLMTALAPWGIQASELTDPLNLFFHVAVTGEGRLAVHPPASPPGATLELRALLPCIVAISTCAVPFAGQTPSGYHIQLQQPA